MRVGQGFDIHRTSDDPSRPLVLGGVTIPGALGLVGHSDADVVTHAIADALLGAAGLGDLGQHFPDTDPGTEGVRSIELLTDVLGLIRAAGYTVGNVDATVVAEAPKLAPHRAAMEASLSAIVGAPVSIKATTMERLGPIGAGEAIAAMAVVLLEGSTP